MGCLLILALTSVILKSQAPPQTSLASTGTARFLTAAGLAAALDAAVVSSTRKSARLLAGTPNDVRLDHLDAVNNASIHPKFGELYIIKDGGGALTTGGTLIGPNPPANGSITGLRIEGGERRSVNAGDVVFIPHGVAHVFSELTPSISYFIIRLPA
jgi:mannose-6-phosphate isomerase-like protein (cupin superfamily)